MGAFLGAYVMMQVTGLAPRDSLCRFKDSWNLMALESFLSELYSLFQSNIPQLAAGTETFPRTVEKYIITKALARTHTPLLATRCASAISSNNLNLLRSINYKLIRFQHSIHCDSSWIN